MKPVKTIAIVLTLLFVGCGGTQQNETQAGSQGSSEAGAPASESARTGSETYSAAPETTRTASGLRTLTIEASGDEKVEVFVEIADEPDEQAKGLMDRTALGDDRGMLFVFPSEEERSFWMRDTLIPLSIAYIDAERRIVDIQDMKALDDDPPHYVSAEPARYALEVNKGFFEEHGVEAGDRVELSG